METNSNRITQTRGLLLKESGYTKVVPTGPYVDDLSPYVSLETTDLPAPAAGQVVLKTILTNVNPSDVHFIKGEYGIPRAQGAGCGFEGVGEVIECGTGTEALMGKRVAYIGTEAGTGGWAEHCIVNAHAIAPIPDGMRDEDAAALFVNPLTAVGMIEMAITNSIENTKEKENGAVILTAANSQLGQYAVAYAVERGFKTICICRRPEAAAMMKEMGATVALCSSDADFSAQMKAVVAELKPRMMLDAVGDTISAEVFWMLPRAARWVIYGLLNTAPTTMTQMGQFVFLNKKIEGFWLTEWFMKLPRNDQARLIADCCKRFMTGTWKTKIDEIIDLDDVFAKLPAATTRPNAGKVMVRGNAA